MRLDSGERKCSKCGKWKAAREYTSVDVCEDCSVENIIRWNGYSRNLKLMTTPDKPHDKHRNQTG